jgi:hypothetical protein
LRNKRWQRKATLETADSHLEKAGGTSASPEFNLAIDLMADATVAFQESVLGESFIDRDTQPCIAVIGYGKAG